MRVDLPSGDGAYAELRGLGELRAKHKRQITADLVRMSRGVDGEQDPGQFTRMPDLILAVMITDWNVPYLDDPRIPSLVPDNLGELTLDDINALERHATPVQEAIFPSDPTTPTVVDGMPDPETPTEPGGAHAALSPDSPSGLQSLTSSDAGTTP